MRIINTLISILLLFAFSCNLHAQGWTLGDTNITEIRAGQSHYYALRRGFTSKTIIDGFLNSGTNKINAEFNKTCIYQFIEVGEKQSHEEVFKTYVLWNVDKKQYVCTSGSKYTASIAEAFKFTARKAKEWKPGQNYKSDWYIYSQTVVRCDGAEAAGTWVLCNPDRFQFLSFEQNHNPGFNTGYIECTNWFIYEVTPKTLTPFEKFCALYDEHIAKNPLSVENYPVGTNPGCISQELYNKMETVYKEVELATGHPEMSEEECNRYGQMILDLVDEYHKGIIPVEVGQTYIINNVTMGFAEDKGKPHCDGHKEIPEHWNVDNAKYLWLADSCDVNGNIFFQNWSTGHYLGQKNMSGKPSAAYKMTARHAARFALHDGAGYVGSSKKNDANKGLFIAGNPDYEDSQWKFYTVESTVLDTLKDKIIQNQKNNRLASLIKQANNNIEGLQYENGITYDGRYIPAGKGLVTKFAKCNATETREGSKEENAFDSNVNTFYHTHWSNKAPKDDWAWVQMNLGKELQEIVVKITKREPKAVANPTRILFLASEGDDLEAAKWTEEIGGDTIIYTYETTYADTIADSCTYIGKIKFSRPVQHIRMTCNYTEGMRMWGYGPAWAVGEMRIYDAAGCVHNKKFDLIPAEVMDALKASIAKAEKEVENGKATDETYEELNEALGAMWDMYPNPSNLIANVNDAQTRINHADESSEEYGYFRAGAKDALQKVVDKINNEIETKVLTLEDIDRLTAELNDGIKAFNNMLIKPVPGIYRIKSTAVKPDGSPDTQFGSFLSALHADKAGDANWRYGNDDAPETRWNTLWEVKQNEEGMYSFRNLVSGLYLHNPFYAQPEEVKSKIGVTAHVHWADTVTYFNLEEGILPGNLMISLDKSRFINAAINGHLAIWNNRGEKRSYYTFETPDVSGFENTVFSVDCQENAIQIKALPITINYAYTLNNDAYKVIGIKDNAIQLKAYGENESIPAGTPFIIVTEKDEVKFETEPAANSLEALIAADHVRTPVALNGLVSSPCAFNIEAGYGLIFQDKIITSVGGERIPAGTGFFNATMPTTTEDGDIALPIDGIINGEGTAVDNIIVNREAKDVYTISGIKVRQNVKGNATNGLPKGIYIVGGKKVIVK